MPSFQLVLDEGVQTRISHEMHVRDFFPEPVTNVSSAFFYPSTTYCIDDESEGSFVPEKMQLIVYTLEHCPNCEILKGFLKKGGYIFTERDLSTAESLTELRVNGIFVNEAPVLQKAEEFFTSADLFPAGKMNDEHVTHLITGE
jgi:glutaredoxin